MIIEGIIVDFLPQFVSTGDARKMLKEESATGLSWGAIYLRLPSGKRMIPVSYVEAIRSHGVGLNNALQLLELNRTPEIEELYDNEQFKLACRTSMLASMDPDGFLTTAYVSRLLCVSTKAVNLWQKRGYLPSVLLSTSYYFEPKVLTSTCGWAIPT